MFSPDGRLLQVEYAKKTVKQGSTALGIVCKDGVVLVADKRIVDKLIVTESVEKIWQIDEHVGVTASGILSDARVLIERAQLRAQQHKITYDNSIDVSEIVKDICDLKQICTQSGGLRPFGVSLLVAGVDETGPILFETDPTGIYFRYKAAAIGEGEVEVEEVLSKEYKESITVDEALRLGVRSLVKILDHNFDIDRIDAAYIKSDKPKFTRLTRKEIENIFAQIKKK
jgi:proteasome alpha subunit